MERPCFYWLRFVSLLRKVLGAEERATVSLSNLSGLEGYHFPGALLAVWSYRESGVLTHPYYQPFFCRTRKGRAELFWFSLLELLTI